MARFTAFSRAVRLGLSLAAVLLGFGGQQSAATEKTTLNGEWRFRIDAKSEGESQQWFKTIPTGTDVVRVPHDTRGERRNALAGS